MLYYSNKFAVKTSNCCRPRIDEASVHLVYRKALQPTVRNC